MTPIYHDNVVEFQHIAPGRAQRGAGVPKTKKNKANHRPSKTCASGGARFFDPKSKKGQLEWRKLIEKGTPKALQNQSKNNTKNHKETKAVSSAKCDRL